MQMLDIIQPVSRAALKDELTKDKLLRRTNKSNNEIYITTAEDSPHVMQEIGRLREAAFRYYGGGTGKAVDIDEFDTMPGAYRQLIVWNPKDEQILGGYRFLCGSDIRFDAEGKPILATAHLFDFSPRFLKEYLPYTVELGRSFVSLDYQATRNSAKGLFVLDNLWDGLGALSVVDSTLQYFFGKVTMYNTYNTEARNLILYFLRRHFPDPEQLLKPITPLRRSDGETFPFRQLQRQLQSIKSGSPEIRHQCPALSQCLHEPFTQNESFRHSGKP